MSWMHREQITEDATPEDTFWRKKCRDDFGIDCDPAERDHYPSGYWEQCYKNAVGFSDWLEDV